MALPAVIAGTVGRAAATGAASGATGAMTGSATASRAIAQLGQFQGSMNQVSVSAQRATHWVGSLASNMTGRLARALTMFIDWVAAAAAPIERLVRVANPGIADAFGLAMNDAFGVVGRSLIPVMESFIRLARKVGNVMAGLEPVFQPAINALSQLIDVIGEQFVQNITSRAPVFEMLATVMMRVAQAATVLVRVWGEMLNVVGKLASGFLRAYGFDGSSFNPKASAVGAAARHAEFVQPKQISDDAIRKSLTMGIGQQQSPKTLNDVDETLNEIFKWAKQRWGDAGDVADRVEKTIFDPFGAREAIGIQGPGLKLARYLAARRQR